jgi:hypothetical protein
MKVEKTEDEMMKTTVVLLIGIMAALCFSSCTSFGAHRMFTDSDEGFVMLAGNASGIQAYNDGLLGHIAEAKASADSKGSYFMLREKENAGKVIQFRSQQQQQKRGDVK